MCYNGNGDSMLPSKIIYKGNIFDTIGLIKLNNGSFIILKNQDEIISLDLSKIEGLALNLKFEVKEATKVEVVLIEYIMSVLRNSINLGEYKNIQQLLDDISAINRYINSHKDLLINMKELDFKDDVVNKNILNLLEYFDEVMAKTPLNLEAITSFQIEGKNYVRAKNENGVVRIMLDVYDNSNQILEHQDLLTENTEIEMPTAKESNEPAIASPEISAKQTFLVSEPPVAEEIIEETEPIFQDSDKTGGENLSNLENLVKEKNSKAAFVDSLLLSFIVGLISGIYATFLIIIILS